MTDEVGETDGLAEARAAFTRRDWAATLAGYGAAADALTAEDHFHRADSAWWVGRIDEALASYEAAFHAYLASDEPRRAALAALLLGAHAIERGDVATGSGWTSRARRILDQAPEGPEHGYPLYWQTFDALARDDLDGAMEAAVRMQALGHRHDEPDLVALGTMAEGRVRLKEADLDRGMALLDEAMVMAVSDDLHPLWTGAIYCHLMDACHELQDLQRASEWTTVTARWCDAVGEAVVYRGICRVHRAQILQRRGDWDEAELEAATASRDVPHVHVGTAAAAHYELGEIRRLRGEAARAEACYRHARELGHNPQPGLALLRAQQGRGDAACASLRVALTESAGDPLRRVPLAAALVEVAVDEGEIETARAAAAELRETASRFGSAGLDATAHHAAGCLLLAEEQPHAALARLRAACRAWHGLQAPYEAARCRLRLARAYGALGDTDAALLELDAAAAAFEQLGATHDAELADRIRRDLAPSATAGPDGLSARETEILCLVATGRTNRQVAEELSISDKTVARHVANIYLKIGVNTRAAATAYAFAHGLVDGAPRT